VILAGLVALEQAAWHELAVDAHTAPFELSSPGHELVDRNRVDRTSLEPKDKQSDRTAHEHQEQNQQSNLPRPA
jgi:hypothetical protein